MSVKGCKGKSTSCNLYANFKCAVFVCILSQEVPENGADVAHLPQVHGPLMPAGVDLRYIYSKVWDFGKHQWNAKYVRSIGVAVHANLFLSRLMGINGQRDNIINPQ